MPVFRLLKPAFISALVFALPTMAVAQPKVVASIKPVHSLVASVMKGVAEPSLIVDGTSSPHDFSLLPSQAKDLAAADVVFWIGPALETFLPKSLETIASKAESIALIETKGLVKFEFREGATFEGHGDHGGHDDHAKHDDHDKHDDHGHGAHAIDPHIFLDPINAQKMVATIEKTLSKADPENAAKYAANAKALRSELDHLTHETEEELEALKDARFIVFHDAYRYFEERFGIEATGSITLNPETSPSVSRIKEIRTTLDKTNVSCVFSEPQFPTKLVDTVIADTKAKKETLDPLGATLEPGIGLYSKLITNMAASFKNCLGS